MKSENIPHGQNSSEAHQKDHRKKHNRYPNHTVTRHLSHSWLSAGISIKSGGLNPMLNGTVQKSSNATSC